MYPGETAEKKLDDLSPKKATAKNVHSTAVRAGQYFELKRELKKQKIKSHGLGTNPLANIHLAEIAIVGHDIKERAKINDMSKSCLGIVRKNDWCNGVTMWLWGMNTLTILAEL